MFLFFYISITVNLTLIVLLRCIKHRTLSQNIQTNEVSTRWSYIYFIDCVFYRLFIAAGEAALAVNQTMLSAG